jgi:hypothetical protein
MEEPRGQLVRMLGGPRWVGLDGEAHDEVLL